MNQNESMFQDLEKLLANHRYTIHQKCYSSHLELPIMIKSFQAIMHSVGIKWEPPSF